MSGSRVFRASLILLGLAFILSAGPAGWAQSSPASPTAATLNASSNNVPAGTAVTLTASVVSGATPVTAGLVVFCNTSAAYCEDSAIVGSAWLTKSGTATIHKVFGLGTHNVQAVFKGTRLYATSTSAAEAVTVTGSGLPTTTTISSAGTPGSYVLTATVTTTNAIAPTGSVSFLNGSDGNYQLASATLGTASLTSGFAGTPGPAAVSFNQAIAAGDFKNNGILDYVISSLTGSATATIMLGNGDGTFSVGASYPSGASPESVVVADFNGDGNLDIAFANSGYSGVTILLGNGDGTFNAGASPAVGWAGSVAVGDFNGDGIPDLAVSNNASGYAVTILLGNGDGTFTVGASVTVPQWSVNPQGIVAMDFNGDGKTDLAVTSSNGYTPASYVVTILLGNGDGTFTTGQTYTTGTSDLSIAGGDFNGDGIPDLAIANYGASTVTVLLGNGDGTFTATASSPVTGRGPYAIVAGDFNGDGKLDLATANFGANTVTILLGNGDGTFTASTSSPATGSHPDGLVAGDFNGDGNADFITANFSSTEATVVLQSVSATATATASGVTAWGSGTQNIVATYGGSSTYQGSSSSALPLSGTPIPAPTLSLPTGTYVAGQTLTISDTAVGAVIYYTTDGSTPTTSSASYATALTLNSSQTVSAIAAFGSVATSSVTSAIYTVVFPQTISFPNPGPQSYGTPLTLSATASSGLAVSFAVTSGPATLAGNTLTFTGVGAVTVQATQAGNSSYQAATPVSVTFTVNPGAQTITFPNPGTRTYGSAPFALTATASSGLAVSYTVTSGPATVSGSTLTITGVGAVTVQATQTGNGNYAAATPVSVTFTVNPGAQSITFPNPGTQTYGVAPISLTATATSGLVVSYAVTSGPATVSGSTLTITGAGSVTVQATQAGNANYAAATPVNVTFTVNPAPQTITFPNPGTHTYGAPPFALTATASSGLAVTYAVTSGPATVSGSTLTITGVGSVTVQATQAGNTNYTAATPVNVTFTVNPIPQTITFPNPGTQTDGVAPITLTATASSGLAVSYAVTSGPATVSGSTLTITAAGSVTVQATQGGSSTYAAATPVSVTFTVNPITLTVGTPTALNFGAVLVGAAPGTSLSLAFVVPSGVTLGSVAVVTGGAPGLDYTITTSTCVSGITNTTCTLAVQFLPTAVGPRLGTLSFTSLSGTTLLAVPITGTGVAPYLTFNPGIMKTIAGGHGAGYTGDSGLATAAQLNTPYGVGVDEAGNVYAADWANNAIRKITPAGIITTVAGGNGSGYSGDGGAATSAKFNQPATVKADGAGNLYVADYYNNVIRKVTPAGIITTVAGGGTGCAQQTDTLGDGCPATSAKLSLPWGTAVDGAGNLYIGDTGDNVVRKVALNGTITTYAGNGTAGYTGDGLAATSAEMNGPQVGAVDGSGNVYIADFNNNVVRKVNSSGVISTIAGDNALGVGYSGDGGQATSAQLYYPQMVAIDGAGNLYIADTGNYPSTGAGHSVIRKVTAAGIISTVAGNATNGYTGDGGVATSAEMYGPWDVAVDASGNLYIADANNDAIRKVDVSDAPTITFASTIYGTTSAAQNLTLLNTGNATLTISSINVTGNFSLGGAATTCGTTNQTLAPAASCVLGIEFTPASVGSLAGSVVLIDNALNTGGNTQTVVLQGTGAIAAQTITFTNPGTQTYSVNPVALTASATSGLAVSFTSTTPTICTVAGSAATMVLAGTCTIQASQAGNADYSAATTVTQSFTINHATQTITFNAIAGQYVGTALPLTATASSGLAVSYTSTTTTVCTVAGSTATMVAAGNCTIQAAQAGNGAYSAATTVPQTFAVTKVPQTITFNTIATQVIGAAVPLTATASSGLTVTITSTTTTICTVAGTTATMKAVGTCTLQAAQAGNATYAAATTVSQSFSVTLVPQTITFNPIAAQLIGASVPLTATASSGLTVSFASTTPTICTVTGTTAKMTIAGTCTIKATQAGNATYAAATPVSQNISVTAAPQVITFTPIADQYAGASTALVATASSGQPVSYASSTTAICTVSGATASMVNSGSCTIKAVQAGSGAYAAAAVSQTFTVHHEAQTVTFAVIPAQLLSTGTLALSATASSGMPVTFSSSTPAVCTVTGSTATLIATGTCSLLATQAGNGVYSAEAEPRSFVVK